MAADQVVSRELKALREELSAARRERLAEPTAPPIQPSSRPQPIDGSTERHEFRDQLEDLANALTGFLEEAERDISAHPGQSVIGALVVGILIGRLLGRR